MPFQGFAFLDVDHPVVAWGVYRGVLVSAQATGTPPDSPVSLMFARTMHLQNNARFQNELIIESVRAQRFPHHVSRLSGMYFFTVFDEATGALSWGGHFRRENLAELEVHPVRAAARVDSNWITYAPVDSTGRLDRTDISWIDRYWQGEAYGDSPIWETIVHGRAVVLGTELRQRAYEVIVAAFPNALDMLEIARLAAAVGSDLGQTAAWVTQLSPDRFRLAYYLDMRDADNPEFLRQLAAYDGPKNISDLAPGKETFGVPDFRQYSCDFTISYHPGSTETSLILQFDREAAGI
ncbi:MAG: DUF2441 domain-containing protein [Nitrospiraceae bacterium]|nr:DUF2441 domain-containing protein [Nitrospiraceae bacterium]